MDCHNFGFGTGYELFDADKKLIKSSFHAAHPEIAGDMEIEIRNADGITKAKTKQPMHSFLRNFIYYVMYMGRRLYIQAYPSTYGYPEHANLGMSNAPVRIQQVSVQSYFGSGNYGGYNSDAAPVSVDSVILGNGFVEVTVSAQLRFTGAPGNPSPIKEVSLQSYSSSSDRSKTIAREVLSEPFTFAVNDIIKMTWHLRFPATEAKMVTPNWINNLIGDILLSVTYTNTNGTICANAHTPDAQYNRSFCSISDYFSSGNFEGLIIGSGSTPCDYESGWWYRLENKIANGTSAGQLVQGTQYKTDVVTDTAAGKAYFTVYREFTNRSGSSVYVNEAGFTVPAGNNMGMSGGSGQYLLARWMTGPIDVQPNQTLRVYWQPTVVAS